jgi:hypothetical protein
VYEELLRLNALDLALVGLARAEVQRRFRQVPERIPRPKTSAPARFFTRARQLVRLFDSKFYLRKYPDVAAARMNPLLHYVRHGAAEDRKPHPLFEPGYYRKCCPEAPANGKDLLAHFLASGAGAANPHPLFDCRAYGDSHGMNPLMHYLRSKKTRSAGLLPAEAGAIAPIEIQDVRVKVFWPKASGQPRWLAEPQQMPFLQSVHLDQLRAQCRKLE